MTKVAGSIPATISKYHSLIESEALQVEVQGSGVERDRGRIKAHRGEGRLFQVEYSETGLLYPT